jgi:hypothetical protein
MPRPKLAVLALAAALAAAPAATAKEITRVEVCGASGCRDVPPAVGQHFHDEGFGGATLERDPGPVEHFRIVFWVGDGQNPEAGNFGVAYAPSVDAVLPLDTEPPLPWAATSLRARRLLERATRGLTPLPAKRLRARRPSPAAPPPATEPRDEAGASLTGPLLAGVPAAALVLGAGLVLVRRRRRG